MESILASGGKSSEPEPCSDEPVCLCLAGTREEPRFVNARSAWRSFSSPEHAWKLNVIEFAGLQAGSWLSCVR